MSKNKKIITTLITILTFATYFSTTKAMDNKPAPEIVTKKDKIEITNDVLQKYRKKIKEIKNKILDQDLMYGIESIKTKVKDIEFINKPIITSKEDNVVKIIDIDINNLVDQLDKLKIKEKDETVDYFINEDSKKKLIDFLQSIKDIIKNEDKKIPDYLEKIKKNNFIQKQITPEIIEEFKKEIIKHNPITIKLAKEIMPNGEEDQKINCTNYELSIIYDILYYVKQLLLSQNNHDENKKNTSYEFLNFNEFIETLNNLKLINSNNPDEYYIDKTDKKDLEDFLNNTKNTVLKIIKEFNHKKFKKYNPNKYKMPISSFIRHSNHVNELIIGCEKFTSQYTALDTYCKHLKNCNVVKKLLFLDEEGKINNKELIEHLKKKLYLRDYHNKDYYIDKADEEFMIKIFSKYKNKLQEIEKIHDNQKLTPITDEMILNYIDKVKSAKKYFVDEISKNKNLNEEEIFKECNKLEEILCLNDFYLSYEKMIDIFKNIFKYNNLNQKFFCICNLSNSIKTKLKKHIYKAKSAILNAKNIKYENKIFDNKNYEIINLIEQQLNCNDYTAALLMSNLNKISYDYSTTQNINSSELTKFKNLFNTLIKNIYITPECKLDKFLLFSKIKSMQNKFSYEDFENSINEKYKLKLERKYFLYKKIIEFAIKEISGFKENIENFSIDKLDNSKDYFEKYLQEKSKLLKEEKKENTPPITNSKKTNIQTNSKILNEIDEFTLFDAFAAPMPTPFNMEQNLIENENKNKIIDEKFNITPTITKVVENKNKIEEINLYQKPTPNNAEYENKNLNNNSENELSYYISKLDPNKLNEDHINKLKNIIKLYEQNKNNQNIKDEYITNNYEIEKMNNIENKNDEEKQNKIKIKDNKKISKLDRIMTKIKEKEIKNKVFGIKKKHKNNKNK